ncbi:hypothetical protein [Streptomyces sp. Y7]|uniref:hypothetical protein n=1 Tax=Streptomyces sp. Y7 TaxID=3342392 RepID=UPI003718C7BF
MPPKGIGDASVIKGRVCPEELEVVAKERRPLKCDVERMGKAMDKDVRGIVGAHLAAATANANRTTPTSRAESVNAAKADLDGFADRDKKPAGQSVITQGWQQSEFARISADE